MSGTTDRPAPGKRRANYGLDAPGVVRNLLLAALLGFLAWPLGLALEVVLWWQSPEPFRIILPLNYMGPSIGLVCLVMGCWMVYYSYVGKLRMRERLLNGIPWRGDEAVLDVGCGRGLLLVGAAKRLTTGKATGIDRWQGEDLAGNSPLATRANALAEGVADRVEIQTGDARELPFADASFDVVVSNAALHNIYNAEGRRAAVREIARVLKPGGRVVISDIRHTAEYAGILRQNGCAEVGQTGSALTAVVLAGLTFGSLRPGTVQGHKARK
jgi:2-polyprenyl-3-methyl-5-hydroxy-6-metoxy-1,4-benzoquinol methylase